MHFTIIAPQEGSCQRTSMDILSLHGSNIDINLNPLQVNGVKLHGIFYKAVIYLGVSSLLLVGRDYHSRELSRVGRQSM